MQVARRDEHVLDSEQHGDDRDAEPVPDAEREPDADEREQHDRQGMQYARPPEDTVDAEARGDRMKSLAPVDVDVEQRVEEVEAGDPGGNGAAELPRLERQLPGDRDPRSHRRKTVDSAEPEMAEPRYALEVRIDDEPDG